ncbi:MAG: YtxH domain-containing protein [Firmicutes bacterium]|nr:YtxH domain-containing protein [Bacillota bacterium]
MREKRFGAFEFSLGVLFGMAIGAVIALLMSPRSGAEIRGSIASKSRDFKTMASELFDQAKNGLEAAASQIERAVGLQERSLRRKLDDIRAQLEEYHLNEA